MQREPRLRGHAAIFRGAGNLGNVAAERATSRVSTVGSVVQSVNRQLTGVYYVGSQIAEVSPWYMALQRQAEAFDQGRSSNSTGTAPLRSPPVIAAALDLPDNDTVDYVFTDPPFGENIYYADLNYLVESWHRVRTASVEHPRRSSTARRARRSPDYLHAMQRCFAEYQRVLKPGRWMTVVFHNSRNAVWNAIQEAILRPPASLSPTCAPSTSGRAPIDR